MNIDKFGHHVHKRLRLTEFIDTLTDTLVKSDTGDFDLKSSKLKGLPSPEQDDEAVTKKYVDDNIEELKNEIKKVHTDLKKYLKNLEKFTTEKWSTQFYSKEEVNRLINISSNKNE